MQLRGGVCSVVVTTVVACCGRSDARTLVRIAPRVRPDVFDKDGTLPRFISTVEAVFPDAGTLAR